MQISWALERVEKANFHLLVPDGDFVSPSAIGPCRPLSRDLDSSCRVRRMKILDSFFASRGLQGKFLAIAVPLVFVTTVALFAISEAFTYRTAERDLHSGLDELVASQSAALSIPLWNLDVTQIALALKAIVTHPDVVGARVFEESGGETVTT